MSLSLNQRSQYDQDGYLVIPDYASPAQCDKLISEAESLVKDFEPEEVKTIFSTEDQARTSNDYFMNSGDKIRFFFEPNAFLPNGQLRQAKEISINKIGHGLHDLNPIFDQFSRQPFLESVCRDVGIKDPILMQSMYIFKQPRIGGEVTCHQDSTFLYTEPMSVLGLWVALQDATISNGCLYALPGGHKTGLKRKFIRNEAGGTRFEELDTSPWPTEGYVPLEVKKGTLVLLHGLLPHLSGPNLSEQSRHAYTLHVIDGAAQYPAENWLQRSPENPALGFSRRV